MTQDGANSLGEKVGDVIEIRKRFMAWYQWILILGCIGLGVVWVLLLVDEGPSPARTVVFSLCMILVLVFIVSLKLRATGRPQLQFFTDGFTLERKGVVSELRFDEIEGLKFVKKDEYSNGTYSGFDYDMRFWSHSEFHRPPQIILKGYMAQKRPEHITFLGLLDAMVSRISAAGDEAMKAGERLIGGSFVLGDGKLEVGALSVSLEDIGLVALFEEKISIWRKTESTPCVSIKPGDVNAVVMMRILQGRIDDAEADVPGMGRILFDKSPGRISKAIAGLFTLVAGVVSLGFAIGVFTGDDPTAYGILLLGGLVTTGIGGAIFVHMLRKHFTCYDKGVAQSGLFGRKELKYLDIGTFNYNATRHYYNGAYTSTSMNMHFLPEPQVGGKAIKYSCSVRNKAEDLDELRDHISKVIGLKMLTKIQAGEKIAMAGVDFAFDAAGVTFRKSKFIGKGDEVFLPYDQVLGFNLAEGNFYLFQEGEEKAVFSMPVATSNFFPSFTVLSMLKYQDGDEEGVPEAELVEEGQSS